MKFQVVLAALCTVAMSSAQIPDVLVHLDLRPTYRAFNGGGTTQHWYDNFGRSSTVGLGLTLEPGLKAVFSQRLERIANDGDPDQLDEYYVEDEGNWRFGKQEVPFGPKFLDRETALGVKTEVIVGGLPLQVLACDAGPGRQRGVVARFGGRLGVSAELGNHFGISATSLSVLRTPEQSPGIGRGYDQVFGVDYANGGGDITTKLEFVAVRGGQTPADFDENVLDLSATLKSDRYRSVTVGFTRAFQQSTNIIRLGGSFYAYKGATIEPVARYKDGKLFDFGVTLRLKL